MFFLFLCFFRDGTDSAFLRLYLSEIPVLVFSAGLGNVVSATLNHYNIKYSNVHVISNFFKMEKGIITGFEGTLLHVFNKNQYAIENCDYFKVSLNCYNVEFTLTL